MSISDNAKQLCMERDCARCRHCGTDKDLMVRKLTNRSGRLSLHLSNLITLCNSCNNDADEIRTNNIKNRVGVVLCGGKGSRLYPLTMYQGKHTLPIGLVPMCFYTIKTLRKFGVQRVLIVTDRDGTGEIMKMLGSGQEFGMSFTYKIQEGAGGISEALLLAKDFAKPKDEIVVILGDNIFDLDELDTKIDLSYDNNYEPFYKSCVYIKKVNNPEAYGVAKIENISGMDVVTKIVEKPKEFVSNMAVVGLYMYTYGVFDVIEQIKPSERGELEISDVNDFYASRGELLSKEVSGYWADCGGSIQRYCEASLHGAKQAMVSEQEVRDFVSIVFDDK